MLEAADTKQPVSDPAKLESSDPDEPGAEGWDEQQTLGILQYLDRLEEVTNTFLKR